MLILILSVPIVAAQPRWNNVYVCDNSFYVDGSDAVVEARYEGIDGVTTSATVEIEIERKGLFGTWSDVSGGSWSDTITGYYGSVEHYVTLSKTGEYRAKITWTVYGTGGSPDTVTETLYYEYE